MAPRDQQRLLERALALPNAQSTDFFGGRRPPSDAAPEHLKVIKDTALRTRLIAAHFAEGLQSPKGPQKIASIIRLYPNADAPSHTGAPPPRAAVGRGPAARKGAGAPTVEQMEALLTRIRAVEGHVARELSLTIDHEIDQLKRKVADAKPEDLEEAYRALGAALNKRRDRGAHVRAEAFSRIEGDAEFAPRVFLRLLTRP